jgi:hypothetical protein
METPSTMLFPKAMGSQIIVITFLDKLELASSITITSYHILNLKRGAT